MSITCQACSYENPDTVQFCEACGSELIVPTLIIPPVNTVNPSPVVPPIPSTQDIYPEFDITASPSPPSIGTAKLLAKMPNAPATEFVLENTNLIGRFDPDTGPVDIDLEGFLGEDTITRHHAEVYQEGGQWKIKDLGSTNGVFIKRSGQNRFNARITQPETILSGDEVAIAKIRFLFQIS